MEVRLTMRFPVVLHSDDGIRYGVTVPEYAKAHGATRSGFLADAARRAMSR